MKINVFDSYEVESCGTVTNKHGAIIKHNITKGGYSIVRLAKERKQFAFSVHRLVALHFIKNNNIAKTDVNHIDGNKLNNDVLNLEWCTKSENTKHAYDTGLMENCRHKSDSTIRKVAESRATFTIGEASELAEMKEALRLTYNELAKIVGVSRDVLFNAITNKCTYYKEEIA